MERSAEGRATYKWHSWRKLLKESRQSLGLSRVELSRLAGVSTAALRAYEEGRRQPRIDSLTAVLEALRLDRGKRNELLVAAGFAPDGLELRLARGQVEFSAESAAAEIGSYPWPAFVANENGEVVAANQMAQSLWDVDLRSEFTSPVERSLLSIASNPRFADRCANWDEAVGIILAGWRAHHRGGEDVDEPRPYFAAVFEHFLQGDPKYVQRFARLWETAPIGLQYPMRWSYPIVWDEPGIGRMRFRCLASSGNEADGLDFHDWIPQDAESWQVLERVKARAVPNPPHPLHRSRRRP